MRTTPVIFHSNKNTKSLRLKGEGFHPSQSETLKTSRIIKENSAICEITDYPIDKMTKDKLYQSAKDLFAIKDPLEQHLSKKTNELFDLKDKIILYDLTNTYFEGRMLGSELAQYSKSKSKEK